MFGRYVGKLYFCRKIKRSHMKYLVNVHLHHHPHQQTHSVGLG